MFGKLIRRPSDNASTVTRVERISITVDGMRYAAPTPNARQWLASPYDFPDCAELGARLAQITLDGFGAAVDDAVMLSWQHVYAMLKHPDYVSFRSPLGIPAESEARPRLATTGALSDPGFSIHIDEWVDTQGRALRPAARLVGKTLQVGVSCSLLPEPVSELLDELGRFHATPAVDRTQAFKQQIFGRARKLAISSGCLVSNYVSRTVILTPERLRMSLDRRGEGDASVLEVAPGFDDAPAGWLALFDRLPLQETYEVPDGPALVRVVPTPEVRAVLAEIKRMPGRRVAGARAQAFVRNPFAVLGDCAEAVLDADQFEAARDDAGIRFQSFMPNVERGSRNEVVRVALLVESLDARNAESATCWIASSEELERFVGKLDRALADGSQCVTWGRHEFEIVGDTQDHLLALEGWLREWKNPVLWTASEVLDLNHYSERIEAIGVEKPFAVPVIARNDEGAGWFESNATVGLRINDAGNGASHYVPLQFDEIPSLRESVAAAEAQGVHQVQLPGLNRPVPLDDARHALHVLAQASAELKRGAFHPSASDSVPAPQQRLIIKRNVEDIDYTESRAGALQLPPDRKPVIPHGLADGIELKPHQELGVAWLQHLWDASPHSCRGTVLADDMGLGKTLQLLTFMVSSFEADPLLPPALVVAPVALLENWRNELNRFFKPGTLPLLLLYGATLRSLRVSNHEIDEDLASHGVTRLLKRNWIGDARLVLTTYETMRDVEFALAREPWSIMVCDEAQKIKNPTALVTRSAKKQKVRFRIACTGTPVENTLADLWCLFDFVQPGMLGALNQFSRNYRRPIEAKTDEQRAKVDELRAVIQPQILHRKKNDVAKELPVPVEDVECKTLPMSPYQQRHYQGALAKLREERETNPSAQLQALLSIRKICTDPHGFAEPDTREVPIKRLLDESPKMGWLARTLKSLADDDAGDHKVIVFCEFRELQLALQRVIAALFGFAPAIVNGDTSADPRLTGNRQELIDAFQVRVGFNVIILSPLAVGFGVNIQAANHVIHFTRTWNPAKEDQATARAYRIGQKRTVTIYYPGVVSDAFPSFDVRLDELLARKRSLASDMLNGCSELTAGDFADFG
ncbi:DEAD/DEAH box helicase [Paraburkholderia flagellata]|uniref:DEAD/DEAH box helicase n=1 Tax=Paraburkholderia flagellata TaxID=2883241 RepID=UPI001F295A3E|nr:DEAD/DEAH box helicase [Paraburkholderia flagellata]